MSKTRLKLAVVTTYVLGIIMPAALLARTPDLPPEVASNQAMEKVITLDRNGTRGIVLFDHRTHEGLINPDSAWPYPAKSGAACSGCHHTISKRGIPQLWKCNSCHRGEGNPKNPQNREFDEVMAERAFHDTCIGCHRATNEKTGVNKGPTTCGGCHKSLFSSAAFEKNLNAY